MWYVFFFIEGKSAALQYVVTGEGTLVHQWQRILA
jgi:hypothetical protein